MKFTIGKEAFLAALQQVQNVVSTRTTFPLLSNVLIEAKPDGLVLTTSDLDLWVSTPVAAEVSKPGLTSVPVRKLTNIVNSLAAAEIEINSDSQHVLTLESGPSYFKMIGLSPKDFPELPPTGELREYRLDQASLRDALKKTAYAISNDETRYILTGTYLSFENGTFTMVATDGRRLAMVDQDLEFPASHETNFILPSKAVRELQRLLDTEGEALLKLSEKSVTFEIGDRVLTSKLIEGNYPNYRQVIPGAPKHRLTLPREVLLEAANRVSLLAPDKSSPVRLHLLPGRLELITMAADIGEAKEELPVNYDGEEFTIAFNSEFLNAPLRHLTEENVYLDLIDEMSPGVFRDSGNFLYVLMPMRV